MCEAPPNVYALDVSVIVLAEVWLPLNFLQEDKYVIVEHSGW